MPPFVSTIQESDSRVKCALTSRMKIVHFESWWNASRVGGINGSVFGTE
jgi:hypothetical protein